MRSLGVPLWVNGERLTVTAMDIHGLLRELGYDTGRGLAVARNGELVPWSVWDSMRLAPDDRIEIVGAVQGG